MWFAGRGKGQAVVHPLQQAADNLAARVRVDPCEPLSGNTNSDSDRDPVRLLGRLVVYQFSAKGGARPGWSCPTSEPLLSASRSRRPAVLAPAHTSPFPPALLPGSMYALPGSA